MKSRVLVMIAAFSIQTFAFVPSSFSAIIWGTEVIPYPSTSNSNVDNPDYAKGPPDGKYASIKPSGYLTVGFGTSFLDLRGPDVVVVDAIGPLAGKGYSDIADVYGMQARHVGGSEWSALKWDISLGGWRSLEIPSGYTGLYDQVKLSYIFGGPNHSFEVDAIGVNNPNTTPVPEPSTLILMGSGLVAIAGLGRKKFTGQLT